MTNNTISSCSFPVGYHKFHKDRFFNFLLNRWYSLGYARLEDMAEAGRKIKNFGDWKTEMTMLADVAVAENRLLNAAFYYRAAEFYTKSDDPDKERLYDKFIDLFYTLFKGGGFEKHLVPYETGFLPAIDIPPASASRGVIVLHGGFDSLIEEWYSIMKYFSELGYRVIGFEGPGQGAALRKYGLPLTYKWEKPVKAVLNHFNLDNITLLGFSMGGWFCLRAAAFEPRVKRVIATGHAIDYMMCMNVVLRKIHKWFIEHYRGFTDRMALKKLRGNNVTAWMMEHMMYITKKSSPMDAMEMYLLMNIQNIHAELIKQDVLILTARNDHFIPFKMHALQINTLKNARSVTDRVFTREEHADNHCQTGNIGLALDVMLNWLNEFS